ncbi:MAG: DUF4870 family protein [Thiomonas sp.]|jgi:uncharacterized membrane protein|uniref:Transmembrane protein n=1 Tax=Thiomonas arsenitoxydans (strain DSM 22701 / CIP 110005 / 3As) TaxID=426114 RepID=A0A8I1MTJ3_THIA3|nr:MULTISPECIES: hypothetical protein [Thiomonas]MDE2174645.1 hypothetical protein [Betaproteobacteria bacterium]CQR41505.1 Transmembrane protein [Thiomonas sp. CB3]MBN8743208.1 hypothetical protein [Thiomonas arsenitoxydans]MBN8776486.1 hypothetical protein [Thiomonas arsenitoxydans]MDD5000903.1 hypothetical protein [Thiomonas arsenitoxydans]
MNDPRTLIDQPGPQDVEGLKTIALVVYVLQALSFFWGITAVIGVIIDYVKLDDARGTWVENHLRWQIRTFWWALFWSVIGFALIWVFGLGFLVLAVVYFWTIYRVVKGWLKLTERKQVRPSL